MKILITDDSLFLRKMLSDILINAGYEVCEAISGTDLLIQYELEHPDIVTLDITMPGLSGIEALKSLKLKHPEAKVIMCSAMGQRDMVLEAIHNGACDFIIKPFEKSKILESIRNATPVI